MRVPLPAAMITTSSAWDSVVFRDISAMPLSIQSPRQVSYLRHIIGALMGLLLAAGLAGCSAIQLGYQNAPSLSYWWLDRYLDFTESQSLLLRQELDTLHAWHRQQQLPLYLNTLGKIQNMVRAETTPEQVCGLYSELRAHYQAALDQSTLVAATLVPLLDNRQLTHLAQQFDKRNQKWRQDWQALSAEQRHDKRVKQQAERAEMFYGRLEERHLAALRNGLSAVPLDVQLLLREATRRQQDTLQTLRNLRHDKATATNAATALRALSERWLDSPDPLYRDYTRQTTQALCKTYSALHNASTKTQREHFAQTLQDYRDDIRALLTTD